VGEVNVAGAADAAAPAVAAAPRSGSEVYNSGCMACHATGAAGAPKVGDAAAWQPRVGQGMDALLASAVNGKGAMPPRGGSSASDEELRAAIEYMLKETGL
jgi:cytochrome c5